MKIVNRIKLTFHDVFLNATRVITGASGAIELDLDAVYVGGTVVAKYDAVKKRWVMVDDKSAWPRFTVEVV